MGEEKKSHNKRNIMILFLSNLHCRFDKNRGGKIIGNLSEYRICGTKTIRCIETNEAPLMEVLADLKDAPLDAIFYFATKKVRLLSTKTNPSPERPLKLYLRPEDKQTSEYASEDDFFWTVRARAAAEENGLDVCKLDNAKKIPIAFNEDNDDPVGSSITAVREMETAITKYLKEEGVLKGDSDQPLSNCNLYADITGGMRTANMVMSAALQLLQYEGAKLKRVVYSDFDFEREQLRQQGKTNEPHFVSNVQPINDMYRLVAGVDAFKKYGSSAALDEYFKDVKMECEPLQKLLDAMNAFSESVLLCQTTTIKQNLKKLMNKLHEFVNDKETKRPEKVELFARMTESLQIVYSPMLPDIEDEPDEVEIIQWCTNNSLIQQALTLCTEWLPEYLISHGALYTDSPKVQRHCLKMKAADPNASKKTDTLGKKYYIMKFLTRAPREKGISRREPHKATEIILQAIKSRESLWQDNSSKNAVGCSRKMMKENRLESDFSDEEALEFIRGYTYIRGDLRNKINHASKDSKEMNLDEVRNEIDAYLMLLRKIRGNKHTLVGLWAENTVEATP